ncbi:amidohydrolase, partial [Mobiluncus curtisii]
MSNLDIHAAVTELGSWQDETYQWLHQHPELSMSETETCNFIEKQLRDFGYQTEIIGGGVVGILGNGTGKTTLFRADMDGLPVREETGLPYASTITRRDRDGNEVPVMHACGHDVHITAGLGAARVLAAHRDSWSGTHIALFQPGEETAEGAKSMVAAGLVDKIPRPDVAFGQHVLTGPMPTGAVGTHVGAILSTG